MKAAFVLLTKNEETVIEQVLRDLARAITPLGFEKHIILLSDDSSDKTRDIANQNGALIEDGGGLGLGRAFLNGVKAAAQNDVDIIFTLDGDGQTDFSEISMFLNTLKTEQADLVIGSRFLKGDWVEYRYPKLNRFGVFLLSTYMSLLTGQRITDSHGGLRLMKKTVIEPLKIIGTHTYVQEAVVDAHLNGFRIVEIPSRWKERKHGESRVLKSIPKYIQKTLPVLIQRAFDLLKVKVIRRMRR